MLGLWLDRTLEVPVALPMTGVVGLLCLGAPSLYAYGEFVHVRWRFATSPASTGRQSFLWLVGHVASGIVLALVVTAPTVMMLFRQIAALTPDSAVQAAAVGVATVGVNLLAGRVLPYERDDVFGLAATASVALLFGAVAWLVLRGLPPLSLLIAGVLVLGASVAVVVAGERSFGGAG